MIIVDQIEVDVYWADFFVIVALVKQMPQFSAVLFVSHDHMR